MAIAPLLDGLLAVLLFPAAWLMRGVRTLIRAGGISRLPLCRRVLWHVGVFPIRDHYYEPLFDTRALRQPLDKPRPLPGIDWNESQQMAVLSQFRYGDELRDLPLTPPQIPGSQKQFHFQNNFFEAGDAEYLYNFVRHTKPTRIIEIGSGYSTLIAARAIAQNHRDDPNYCCEHICIEPYENSWLSQIDVTVIRQPVESVPLATFQQLHANDLLFIDSSHMIRPQGDVLFEYLELLPQLNAGVYVHIHDIFSPCDYPADWLTERIYFWNEQYLLEAFLSHNSDWQIVGALHDLHRRHFAAFQAACPFSEPHRSPGSFYIQKIA
ncbi:MAG: class I SAM-dependent methyltransferase [Oscillatoriales cyanobacterium SM2_2_1]|nr:class I SAM-dependent methyltransferase [Oscillatoriales cyanobacterium SM2_2_1]